MDYKSGQIIEVLVCTEHSVCIFVLFFYIRLANVQIVDRSDYLVRLLELLLVLQELIAEVDSHKLNLDLRKRSLT